MNFQVCTIGAIALICLASEVISGGVKSDEGGKVQCCPDILPSPMGWGWGQNLECPKEIGNELKYVCTQELCGKDKCQSNEDCGPGNVCCCRECNNQCFEGVPSSSSGSRIG